MGKFEILEYLERLRASGDDEFYRYVDIHEGMRKEGGTQSYCSVWRSILRLYNDDLLEVEWEGELLKRNPKFRGRKNG